MSIEEQRHIEAQIRRLIADAERHDAIANELRMQSYRMKADLKQQTTYDVE